MRVAGIIINYRTPELTANAVDGLLAELEAVGSFHVFVVDNDSQDGSVEQLGEQAELRSWGDRVSVLAAPRNGGYGYGINLAAERASSSGSPPDYVYVINSDAWPDRGSVARLVAFMDAHPDAGMAGCHVHGPDGASQGAAFRFPSVWSELETTAGIGLLSRLLRGRVVALPPPAESQPVDWVPGTSMLIRRRALEDVGYFDEAFFLYFEEIDFCRRLARCGWKRYFVAGAPVTHIGYVSTGMGETRRPMPRYWFDSRHRYLLKHHGKRYAAACDAAWLSGYALSRVKNRLLRRASPHRPRMGRDLLKSSLHHLSCTLPLTPETHVVAPKHAPASHDGAVDSSNGVAKHAAATPGEDARPASALGLLEALAEDFATHDHDLLQPGLWAVAAHRVGAHAASAPRLPARLALGLGYRVLFRSVDWLWGIHLPRDVELGRRVRLWHNGCMLLTARAIGNDVHIRHDTTFGPVRGLANGKNGLPVIQDRADIGSGACVLGAITVGHDALVGANSVVMKNVPPHATVLGVPARVVPA